MSFFKKLWASIKSAFQKMTPEAKAAIHIGVQIVDRMKEFAASPIADIMTALIPGEVDDVIKVKLREFLPKILVEMKLADKCGGLTDPNEIVACALQTLVQIEGDWIKDGARKNFYDSLAVLLAQVATDGKLSWDDAKYVLKWYYDHGQKAA